MNEPTTLAILGIVFIVMFASTVCIILAQMSVISGMKLNLKELDKLNLENSSLTRRLIEKSMELSHENKLLKKEVELQKSISKTFEQGYDNIKNKNKDEE